MTMTMTPCDLSEVENHDLPLITREEDEVTYLVQTTGIPSDEARSLIRNVLRPLREAHEAGRWTGFPLTSRRARWAAELIKGGIPWDRAVLLHRNMLQPEERPAFIEAVAVTFAEAW